MQGKLRRLRFEQLEKVDLLSITFPVDESVVEVQGGTLTVSSIHCSTLIIGGGAGGGGIGGPGTMSGGTLRYSSDAFNGEQIYGVNGANLICTDPADPVNAWRSTEVVPGEAPIVNDGVTKEFGPKTLYKNRFGNVIATEQEVTDTENGVSTTETSYMAGVYTQDSATVYAQEAVTDIIPGVNELTVDTTDEGTVVYQHANYGFLDQQTVTRDGATQLTMTSDGTYTTLTIGDEILVTPLDPGLPGATAASSDPGVMEPKYVGVDGMFKVAHGTSVWEQIASTGTCPSGDYAQPASSGSGYYSISRAAPIIECTSTVMLFGTKGYSCNTLQSSDVSNHSGTIMGYMIGGSPGAVYAVSYYVEGFLYVTTSDPSNPTVGGTPCGRVNVTLSDASGFTTTFTAACSSGVPIPGPGGVLKVPMVPTGGVVNVSPATGGAWVATLSPSMENRGPGIVVFVGTMYIKSITLVSNPPGGGGGANAMAADALYKEVTWDIFKSQPVMEVVEAVEVPAKNLRQISVKATLPQLVDDWVIKSTPAQIHEKIFSDLDVNLMESLL